MSSVGWKQDFENFQKAFKMFSIAINRFDLNRYEVEVAEVEKLAENFDPTAIGFETEVDSFIYELQGTAANLLHHFKLNYKLIVKLLGDYLRYEGESAESAGTPRSVLKKALEYHLISDYELWEKLLKVWNRTIREYLLSSEVVMELRIITEKAYPEFKNIYDYLNLRHKETFPIKK